MGLVGRLEDLALPDILQIISLTKRTGKLSLTRREGTGVIIFKDGQVVYAVSDSRRDALGGVLIGQKLITESMLMTALEAQHRSSAGKRLGTILVEKGFLTKDTLEKVLREQIRKVMGEFLTWKSGFFNFEMSAAPNGAEVEVDAKDFLLDEGVGADHLLPERVKALEAQAKEAALKGAGPAAGAAHSGPAGAEPAAPKRQSLGLLKAVLAGIRSSAIASDVSLTLMRFAAEIVSRGVLFYLTKDGIKGMSRFGIQINGTAADEQARKILLPLHPPSLLTEVSTTRQTYRGKLPKSPGNEYLVKQLGGSFPQEVIAIPLVVDGKVVMIFYGDDLPKNRPFGEIEGLELLMIHAGLAMEKDMLARKLESLEQKGQEVGSRQA